jgi:hypothetical protein
LRRIVIFAGPSPIGSFVPERPGSRFRQSLLRISDRRDAAPDRALEALTIEARLDAKRSEPELCSSACPNPIVPKRMRDEEMALP